MVTPHPTCRHQLRKEVFIMRKNKITKGFIETIHTEQFNGKHDASNPEKSKEVLYEHFCTVIGGKLFDHFQTKPIPEDKIYSSVDDIVCALVEDYKQNQD